MPYFAPRTSAQKCCSSSHARILDFFILSMPFPKPENEVRIPNPPYTLLPVISQAWYFAQMERGYLITMYAVLDSTPVVVAFSRYYLGTSSNRLRVDQVSKSRRTLGPLTDPACVCGAGRHQTGQGMNHRMKWRRTRILGSNPESLVAWHDSHYLSSLNPISARSRGTVNLLFRHPPCFGE